MPARTSVTPRRWSACSTVGVEPMLTISHGRPAARIAAAAPTAASRSAVATGTTFAGIVGVVGMPRMGHDAAQAQARRGRDCARQARRSRRRRRQAAAVLAAVDLDHERERDVALGREGATRPQRPRGSRSPGSDRRRSPGCAPHAPACSARSSPHRGCRDSPRRAKCSASRSVDTVMPSGAPPVAMRATSTDLAVFRCGRSATPSAAQRSRMRRSCAPAGRDRARDVASRGPTAMRQAPARSPPSGKLQKRIRHLSGGSSASA